MVNGIKNAKYLQKPEHLHFWKYYTELGFQGGKPPLILVSRFARTNVTDFVR
jgi:hypothetical protein